MFVRRLSALAAVVVLAAACSGDDRGPKFSQLDGREFSATSAVGYPWPDQFATDRPFKLIFLNGMMALKGSCDQIMAKVTLEDGVLTTARNGASHVGVGCVGHALDVDNWQQDLYIVPMRLALDGRNLTVTATVHGQRVVVTFEEIAFVGPS